MQIVLKAPFDTDRLIQAVPPPGRTLGELCAPYQQGITGCLVNGIFHPHWEAYHPQDTDHITLFLATEAGALGITLAAGYSAFTIAAVNFAITTAITLALSFAINAAIRALTTTPVNEAGKTEQVFGLSGLTNTTALGTPKFHVYGRRRVFGHIISTTATISEDGKTTAFGILYFMGEGVIEGITDIEINDTPLAQFPDVSSYVRLGDGNAALVPGFDMVSQVWSDGRTLSATPIVYTTKSVIVEELSVILATPFLFSVDSKGAHHAAIHEILIEWKLVAAGSYVNSVSFNWSDNAEATRFRATTFAVATTGQYNIRVTLLSTSNQGNTPPVLFNVQERNAEELHYDTSALLGLTGIASSQITSFEAMRASGLVQGRRIKKPVLIAGEWDGSTYETVWSDNRAWIVRELLTNASVGLGHRIHESVFDDATAVEIANYWDEEVEGIARDSCNVLLNDRRAGLDWIKSILVEGHAALIPSAGQLKLIVERAGSPALLYSMPGNMSEGSLVQTMGSGQGEVTNTLIGQFADASAGYNLQPFTVTAPGAESEPVRSELVTILTLTDIARVYWLLRSKILRKRLVQRHFSWVSPSTALVSEPFDLVSLAYDSSNFVRGVSGFCPQGSTTGRLLLDRPVTLAPSTTYALILRHQADNTREDRLLSTTAGVWGAVAPTTPFTTAPVEGDLWALGEQSVSIKTVLIEAVSRDDAENFSITASEYQATLYDTPTPPGDIAPGPPPGGFVPPPLWNVSVSEQVTEQPDGSQLSMIVLDVTPGLQVHAGTAQGGRNAEIFPGLAGGCITLDPSEPLDAVAGDHFLDGYYGIPAVITLTGGTGVGQVRTLAWYDSTTQEAATYEEWATIPDATTTYAIDWLAVDTFSGFSVDQADATGRTPGPFHHLAGVTGTTYRFPAQAGPYTTAFRVQPYGLLGNVQGRGAWIVIVGITGDTTPPDPPSDSSPSEGC
jgi:hypothetical protein